MQHAGTGAGSGNRTDPRQPRLLTSPSPRSLGEQRPKLRRRTQDQSVRGRRGPESHAHYIGQLASGAARESAILFELLGYSC